MKIPTGDVERAILTVLSEVLHRDDLGLHESFFDLGANSLTIAQARHRLSEMLGREISLIDLFTYPNVAALAAHLAGTGEARGAAEGVARAQQRLARLGARRGRVESGGQDVR
jgi:hypothetical protein